MANLLPISVIIATANRSKVLQNTIRSIALQHYQPAEIIIIDGSDNGDTKLFIEAGIKELCSGLHYEKAKVLGAAQQRNQGIKKASYDVIGFMDDDIILDPGCIYKLWEALINSAEAGGVNALITNQQYQQPRTVTRLFYQLMAGKRTNTFQGKVFGPVINLLPGDDAQSGEIVPVEWLNTTCTLYRREMLPEPVFDEHFEGYSFMEDLALSLRVAKKAHLYNVRTARIFHDTQPGLQKNNSRVMAEMDLVNRYYIMRNILMLKGVVPYTKLFLHQLYYAIATKNIFSLSFLRGKYSGLKKIFKR